MQRKGEGYTILFSGAVCIICSAFVAGAAVFLKDKQDINLLVDRKEKVLTVCHLIEPTEKLTNEQVLERFEKNIVPKVVDLKTGDYVPEDQIDPAAYDQQKAKNDPAMSEEAPRNPAQISRVPKYALVYQVKPADEVTMIVLPIEGKGLWSTLYGYLVLDKDLTTILGLTFYAHAETPGLGGEVDNPSWKAKWPGRKAFDEAHEPAIAVVKGGVGSPEEDPHKVDALSGATITSNGVTYLLQFWLGENGFGPYLDKLREPAAASAQPA
ncbi:MAG: hypothetical protein AMXMBFR84_19250 [Candidatus Hydrogenedentota bacterium]